MREYEKAADSLELMAQDTQYETLAKKLSFRARELRDKRGEAEPLLTDLAFLRSLALNYCSGSVKSQAGAGLKQAITMAEQLSSRVLSHLPGTGE